MKGNATYAKSEAFLKMAPIRFPAEDRSRPFIWRIGAVDPADLVIGPPGRGIPIHGDPSDAFRGLLPRGFDVIGFVADTMRWDWPTRCCRTRPFDRERGDDG